MTTLLESARQNAPTPLLESLADEEGLSPEALCALVASGQAVVVGGAGRRATVVGGRSELTVKVNANIGTSTTATDIELEVEKTRVAESLGARVLSDCSVGGDLDVVRRALLAGSPLPLATVPAYQATVEAGKAAEITMDLFLEVAARQLEDGASALVVHAAMDRESLRITREDRVMGMVSRGGTLTARWMEARGDEVPLEGRLDELIELLRRHDAVLVIGNAARSGCVHDRLDEAHRREAARGEEVAARANASGVQVIVEAVGGHVHIGDIGDHVQLYKSAGGRPLFAAGPLAIDAAMGNDHLAATIGGAIAAGAGADLLCYITPAEHLGLPTLDDVREGTNAFVVAAYCGDAMRRGPLPRDLELAQARRRFDWGTQLSLAINSERARARHEPGEGCSMCGEFCPMKDPD